MATEPTPGKYSTFREAYCAVHQCRDDQFVPRVFWQSLYRHAIPLAAVLWVVRRSWFDLDVEMIQQFGASRATEDVDSVTGEFSGENRRLRGLKGLLRRLLRIRTSGTRVADLHHELLPYIRGQEAGPGSLPSLRAAAPFEPRSASPAVLRAALRAESNAGRLDNMSLILRRLRQVHDEITSGQPLAQVAAGQGVSVDVLLEQLETHGQGNPEFTWLAGYIRAARRLSHLETENDRLTRKVAQLSMDMDTLNEKIGKDTGRP